MDRQTVLIIAAAMIVLTLIGVVYLGPSGAPSTAHARGYTEFSPEDIRYKFQKKEEAYAKKHKGQKPPPDQVTPDISTPAASDSDALKNDESVEHDAAEEPPIE